MSIDKHNVRKGETILFADGIERTIFPLTLKSLRKFVKVIDQLGNLEDAISMSDEDIDVMTTAAQIILERVDPALASDRDQIEDVVDVDTFQKLMSVAMGSSSPEE
jgi:hypothetical protein